MNHTTPTPVLPHTGSNTDNLSRPTVPARVQRILVVDDEEDIRRLISSILAREGFDVKVAADGEEARDELHRKHYDLLVTDNEMPRLTGLELIQWIRKEGMNLPVILASGSLPKETAHAYAQLQIAAVIPKPFNNGEFLTIAKIALQESGREIAAEHRTYANSPRSHFTAQADAAPPVHNHVLIADDDSVVRGSLAAVLESEGYVVDEARNGIEAVNHAIEHAPDLVLLDLNMPHADGWTAFSQLDRVTPLLPVIVITARPNQYKEAVRVGVDAFMEKPLNIPVLVKAIKRLTSENQDRHLSRITNPAFVTRLLDSADSCCSTR